MINIKITDEDGKVLCDCNAKAVCGAIIKPELEGEEADTIAFLNGRGNKFDIISNTLITLGNLTTDGIENEDIQDLVVSMMVEIFKRGAHGTGIEVEKRVDDSHV